MRTKLSTVIVGGWFTSSLSQDAGNCVEVKFDVDQVLIRDSKYLRDQANDAAAQPIIAVPVTDWSQLVTAVRAQQPSQASTISYTVHPDGSADLHGSSGVILRYTSAEWEAFTGGVHRGEFSPRPAHV